MSFDFERDGELRGEAGASKLTFFQSKKKCILDSLVDKQGHLEDSISPLEVRQQTVELSK